MSYWETPPDTVQTMRSWERRELPILRTVLAGFEHGDLVQDISVITKHTGLEDADALHGLELLYRAGYVEGLDVSTLGTRFALIDIRPTERAMRATGGWPGDPLEDLVALVDQRLAATDDPELTDYSSGSSRR